MASLPHGAKRAGADLVVHLVHLALDKSGFLCCMTACAGLFGMRLDGVKQAVSLPSLRIANETNTASSSFSKPGTDPTRLARVPVQMLAKDDGPHHLGAMRVHANRDSRLIP